MTLELIKYKIPTYINQIEINFEKEFNYFELDKLDISSIEIDNEIIKIECKQFFNHIYDKNQKIHFKSIEHTNKILPVAKIIKRLTP